MLVKCPNFLGDILSILRDYHYPVIRVVPIVDITLDQARIIYSNMVDSPFYNQALMSLLQKEQFFMILLDTQSISFDIESFKRDVQGPFGTKDNTTIRGHLYEAIGVIDGYVHVPDSFEKANEDERVLMCLN